MSGGGGGSGGVRGGRVVGVRGRGEGLWSVVEGWDQGRETKHDEGR